MQMLFFGYTVIGILLILSLNYVALCYIEKNNIDINKHEEKNVEPEKYDEKKEEKKLENDMKVRSWMVDRHNL